MVTDSKVIYHDSVGVSHGFAGSYKDVFCPGGEIITDNIASSSQDGYLLPYDSSIPGYFPENPVTDRDGNRFNAPINVTTGAASITDSNGNVISSDGNGNITDTTGNVAFKISSAAPPSTKTYSYQDTSGQWQQVSVVYKTYTVQTNFGCTGVGEYGPTSTSLVDSINYPDGSAFHFSYEATPLHSGNVTGRISGIQLPQGGWVSYAYTGGNQGITCADGSTAGLSRTLTADSGSASSIVTYARSSPNGTGTSHTEVVDGLSNHIAYDFVLSSGNYYETLRKAYQGAESGTPVLARNTCYNGASSPCTSTAISSPISQIDTYETLDGISTHGHTSTYNYYQLMTAYKVWDFGTSSRGSLLSSKSLTYSSTPPIKVTEEDIYDGNGTSSGKTVYSYDGTAVSTSSGVPQHVAMSGPRGNLTTLTQYANASSTLTTTATYEDTGSPLTVTTPNGTTTYSYDPTFVYKTGVASPTPSSGVALQTSSSFDTAYTGLPTGAHDFNNQPSTIGGYDAMLRPTTIQDPDGGSTTIQYESVAQTGIDQYQTSTIAEDTENLVDGYARRSRTAIANGQTSGQNWYQKDTCYDANGNIGFASYSYRANGFASSKVCSGSGDSFSYDVLGRLTKVTRQTGELVTYGYLGRSTQVTNENGASHISQIDGLGRPKIVCEISGSTLQGISPVSCGTDKTGTGFVTSFAYTLPTPTVTITQGAQTRTFQTDWLGRTTSITEPESGTTSYSYTYNSTGLVETRKKPKANQSNASTLTTTTYQFDSISRLISATYDDGVTPARTFAYDASAGWSDLTQTNLKGRMSLASVTPTNANAKTIFGYDAMGRVVDLDACLPSGCGNVSYNKKLHYAYDWVGNMLSSTDGGGTTSTYTVSPAGEILSLASSLSNSNNKSNVLSNVVNNAYGPASFSLGNGLTVVYSYDSIGRNSGGWVCSGGSTSPGCAGGTQVYGFTSNWTGDLLKGSSDSVLNQTSSYVYDEFDRLSARTVTSGTVQNFTYGYDRYGNRWSQNVTAGSGPAPQFSFVASNNQITPSACNPPTATQYCYDSAGEVLADGFHTYTYDAEGNITAVDGGQTAQYYYNALNQRIKTVVGSTSREFVFNSNVQRVSVWNGSTPGQQIEGQYYWANNPIAYYDSGGPQHFQHQDWLGTERIRTSYSGAVEDNYTSLPFGDSQTTGSDLDQYHFAALDYDASSNSDHAQFRQYSPTQGRWFLPDPYSGSYDNGNPQSFNRYSYSASKPLSFTDALGLVSPPFSSSRFSDLSPWALKEQSFDANYYNQSQFSFGSSWNEFAILGEVGPSSFRYGSVTYDLGTDEDGDPAWIGSNGDLVSPGSETATEIGAPNIYGEMAGTIQIASQNSKYHCELFGPCTRGPAPDKSKQLVKWVKWYLCGDDPISNAKNYALEGATKGAIVEGAAGWIEAGPAGGAIGGLEGGANGLAWGGITGEIASTVCWKLGMYK